MAQPTHRSYYQALFDFRDARRKADLQAIIARLTGRPDTLLSYDQVRQQLRAQASARRELRDIPLDAVIGSVDRYNDFTRSFLPRLDSDKERWATVGAGMADIGLPPVEVYQIGETYFVSDGHHRISVARQMNAPTIQAYVTPVDTRVPLTPDVQPDDLIVKARLTDFLERTRLDSICPEADLAVTAAGQYRLIEADIEAHRFLMERDRNTEITYEDAVRAWFHAIYSPIADIIRQRGMLRDFPGRTEADLYVWLVEHCASLSASLGWDVPPGAAAEHLSTTHSPTPGRRLARLTERLRDAIVPTALESGPPPGQWRREQVALRHHTELFTNLLVSIGGEATWPALDQAIEVARHSRADLHGLHVVSTEAEVDEQPAAAIQAEFARRCQQNKIDGQLTIEAGDVAESITRRAGLADLVVFRLLHPPADRALARLGSGIRRILRGSACPVMAVPGQAVPLRRALLAYDGSPRACEALFIAAYLAGAWEIPLVVVSVDHGSDQAGEWLDDARAYLAARDVAATFVQSSGPVGEAILAAAETHQSDLILIGGYSKTPVVELMLGSVVDEILRRSTCPVLICS